MDAHGIPCDNRRCTWCRRLCRYFGEDQYHHCRRCQMWNNRNRCCQIKNTLCSNNSNRNTTALPKLVDIVRRPGLWARILNMECGSIHELDNSVQERIWWQILCGSAPIVDSSSDSESDNHFWKIIYVSASLDVPSSGNFGCWRYGVDHRPWFHTTMTDIGTLEYYILSLLF